jgi:hypothetical protein
MAQPALDRESILEAVRNWTAAEQIALVQQVLDDLRSNIVAGTVTSSASDTSKGAVKESPRQRGSLRNLVGLLATDQPPPTDEEVERWLEEHRMDKYGR